MKKRNKKKSLYIHSSPEKEINIHELNSKKRKKEMEIERLLEEELEELKLLNKKHENA
jgi:hypothetical protein